MGHQHLEDACMVPVAAAGSLLDSDLLCNFSLPLTDMHMTHRHGDDLALKHGCYNKPAS
jgi:hypothetical protein